MIYSSSEKENEMGEALLDALIDTAKMIGILYLVYLIVAYLEHHNNQKFHHFMQRTQKAGPFMGAVLGIVPQCGFSAVMSDLFAKHKITIGTLVAVFVATSDEAIPILISHPEFYKFLIILLGIKFVYATAVGFAMDGIIALIHKKKGEKQEHNEVLEKDHDCEHDDHCDHCDSHHCCADNIFLDALKHTAIIAAFVFVATAIINIIMFYVGTESMTNALMSLSIFQPLVAAAIGLIPNCCASVVLLELFIKGGLSFGSLVAGLCAGSGVGLLVLFKQNKSIKQNLLVLFTCYITGAALGMIICLF